tara:strand:+ start:24043 stop:24273 length:231 start_codon:yes stop_codon:yes gene_type:complete
MKGKVEKIVLKMQSGTIKNIYHDAVDIAKSTDCKHVEFPFNGIIVVVNQWLERELSSEQFTKIQEVIGNDGEYVYL